MQLRRIGFSSPVKLDAKTETEKRAPFAEALEKSICARDGLLKAGMRSERKEAGLHRGELTLEGKKDIFSLRVSLDEFAHVCPLRGTQAVVERKPVFHQERCVFNKSEITNETVFSA